MLRLGFAVLVPMRRGYGASPGNYAESTGSCENGPRYDRAGSEAARDVLSAIEFIRKRPSLDHRRIVLMGQSAGGFASLATAALNPQGVVAVINMSGGRGGNGKDGIPCAADTMATVISGYARTTAVPVLWLYSENDKYFGPAASRAWYDAFQAAGGKGRFVMGPPHGNDGHLLFYAADGLPVWSAAIESFLRDFGVAVR
jgi:dienelactone hydrolase